VGKGKVHVLREEPMNFVLQPVCDAAYFALVKRACEAIPGAGTLETKNNLYLERGPYVIASVMDESVSADPLVLTGLFIDLFDPELPVLQTKTVHPGEQAYLYNAAQVKDKNKPAVLCGGSRISGEQVEKGAYTFTAQGPAQTNSVMRVYLPAAPKEASRPYTWDEASHTCLLKFENNPDGVTIAISF
jgi:hypothetical protein